MKKKPILLFIGLLTLTGIVYVFICCGKTFIWDAGNYAKRGQSKREQGDIEGALKDFIRAAELASSDTIKYANQHIAESRGGKIHLLPNPMNSEKEDIFSTLAFGYFIRGIAKLKLGDNEGADSDFDKAFELNPSLQTYVKKE